MQDVDFDERKACFAGPDGARSGSVAYDLLVGADGANSAVRRLMQVRGWGQSAPQRTTVCCLQRHQFAVQCAAKRARARWQD